MYIGGMKLREYLDQLPRGQRTAARKELAEAIGVSFSAINHYCNGIRSIPASRVKAISKATGGKVSVEDLLPD